MVVLFICLLEVLVLLENFWLTWRRHYYRWRAAILTYARHSWPLSSEGSLACQTYCDTGYLFIMIISGDSWHSHLFSTVKQLSYHYLFLQKGLSRLGFEHDNFRLRAHWANAAVFKIPATVSNWDCFSIPRQLKVAYYFIFATFRIIVLMLYIISLTQHW